MATGKAGFVSPRWVARRTLLRFSLTGVCSSSLPPSWGVTSSLTIPAAGIGGSWIVKLPSMRFEGVPENGSR